MDTFKEGFYLGKRVFITGHTGFKGGWLVAWLKLLGARVVGFSLPPENYPNLFESAKIGNGMVSIFGDIRDFEALSSSLQVHKPEIIFHAAAQPLVRRSYHEPVQTYATNVMGTVHVLEAARRVPSVRAVVVVTSDKCYENREWLWGYRESDQMGGHDPYSSSKGCAELVTAAYRSSYFMENDAAAIASVRAGNVIGGGDWADDRIVPDIVRGISADKSVYIRHPGAIRPWQHVLEPLRGYLMLGRRLWNHERAFAGAWNFGPNDGEAIPVREVAEQIVNDWGRGRLVFQEEANRDLHEARFLKLDCGKSRIQLGWRPLFNIRESLQWTINWYKGFLVEPHSAAGNTMAQIVAYMDRLGAKVAVAAHF